LKEAYHFDRLFLWHNAAGFCFTSKYGRYAQAPGFTERRSQSRAERKKSYHEKPNCPVARQIAKPRRTAGLSPGKAGRVRQPSAVSRRMTAVQPNRRQGCGVRSTP
jgi:hypothetical protein